MRRDRPLQRKVPITPKRQQACTPVVLMNGAPYEAARLQVVLVSGKQSFLAETKILEIGPAFDPIFCRDAIEACNGLAGEEAEACFLVFGLDCNQTRKNFATVARLEAALDIPCERPAQTNLTCVGTHDLTCILQCCTH